MGGDKRKNIQRDAVYVNERIPPFANFHQRGRDVQVKLRELIKGEAIEGISVSFPQRKYFPTYTGECGARFSF